MRNDVTGDLCRGGAGAAAIRSIVDNNASNSVSVFVPTFPILDTVTPLCPTGDNSATVTVMGGGGWRFGRGDRSWDLI